jgi:hypothetical protein
MNSQRSAAAAAILCATLAAGDIRSRAAGDEAIAAPNTDVRAAMAPKAGARLPVFVPPNRGAPKTRVGGATRGKQLPGTPSVAALVPEEGGLTVEAQPVLYWYLSESTTSRVDVTIVDEASVTPLLETTIQGPLAPGVHAIRLADHGVSLAPGINYQWFVALVPDSEKRSNDVIAGGSIERVAPPEPLREQLAAAAAEPARSSVLAEAGIWYDALDAMSRAVEASPRNSEARDTWAALLEQVGLTEVARVERDTAGVQGQR